MNDVCTHLGKFPTFTVEVQDLHKRGQSRPIGSKSATRLAWRRAWLHVVRSPSTKTPSLEGFPTPCGIVALGSTQVFFVSSSSWHTTCLLQHLQHATCDAESSFPPFLDPTFCACATGHAPTQRNTPLFQCCERNRWCSFGAGSGSVTNCH